MRIGERLNRVEQTVQTKLQGLLTPKAELDVRGVRVKRLLDYLGLPCSEDGGMADRCETDERVARVMLTTGLDEKAAHIRVYADQRGITEDQAREWLRQLGEAGGSVERDIAAGVPPEQSEKAALLRELLVAGPQGVTNAEEIKTNRNA